METSLHPGLRAGVAGKLNRTVPPPAVVATTAMTRVGRSRLGQSDVATAPKGGVARQTLAGSGDRLLADARDACRREGVIATRRQLLMRIAKRIGLSQAEVTRRLGSTIRHAGAAASCAAPRARRLCGPVSRLAATILGACEREVFLARREARPDDIMALNELASGLGVSVERVYELEASARRKLARALMTTAACPRL